MKHKPGITAILILVFFIAQIVGLIVVNEYIDIKKTSETGKTVTNTAIYEQAGIQPPEIKNESFSFLYIMFAVLMGTVIVLLIVKFKKRKLWKLWFFLSVFVTLLMAWSPFVYKLFGRIVKPSDLVSLITLALALFFAWWKIFRPNIYVHNLTEIFVYGGLAALLVPIINLFAVIVLLVLISLYDMYAVWKSKHMVKIATFQTQTFAGLMIPYDRKMAKSDEPPVPGETAEGKPKVAILGGGDVAFPLLFSGVIMKTTGSYLNPLITTIFVTIALAILLIRSEKGKFYPAMPFLTIGCFAGSLVVLLIHVL